MRRHRAKIALLVAALPTARRRAMAVALSLAHPSSVEERPAVQERSDDGEK
jgi:hypothetical protein